LRILFLLSYIKVEDETLVTTTIIRTTSYWRVSKNNFKIIKTQKFRNSKTQEKECKKQINFNELLKSKISKFQNTRLTIQKSRYYQIKKKKKKKS